MKNLTEKEMIAIGGGNASGIALSVTSSADSLLKLTFESSYGERHSSTTLSIGNNINLDLSSWFTTTSK
ncbi:hypothetical protein ACJVDH_10895 [Pedobacter sp. AW1-32]|uniref:hypothetical protein n=1 Tax=Pedobacter sp. AW1-32 TaxID=3383026 RepID=UPI003FEEC194